MYAISLGLNIDFFSLRHTMHVEKYDIDLVTGLLSGCGHQAE
jgi:hypothetical protein